MYLLLLISMLWHRQAMYVCMYLHVELFAESQAARHTHDGPLHFNCDLCGPGHGRVTAIVGIHKELEWSPIATS